jgi:hypothetical protein
MELAGLEPATSWVRSVSRWDSGGQQGTVEPFSGSGRAPDSPSFPLLYSPILTIGTTGSGTRPGYERARPAV